MRIPATARCQKRRAQPQASGSEAESPDLFQINQTQPNKAQRPILFNALCDNSTQLAPKPFTDPENALQ